jgi:hypothetical protein
MFFIGQDRHFLNLSILNINQGENIAMSEMPGSQTVKSTLSL